MGEIKVNRRSSNGREVTYCVAVVERTDRALHNVTVGHSELYGFNSHRELLTFVFETILARSPKQEIRSSFRLKDLLDHDRQLRHEMEGRTLHPKRQLRQGGKRESLDPEREQDEAVREWLTA